MKKERIKKKDGSYVEFVDIEAFGHKFKELLPGHAEELITLEKEGGHLRQSL